jgi:hypothetical protein
MSTTSIGEPNRQALYDTAALQEGLFTTRQPAAAGYSDPLLAHYQKVGRLARIRRGIYCLIHFPSGEQEELVAAWLWTDAIGVLSHQTASTARSFRRAARPNSPDATADVATTSAPRPEGSRAPLRRCTTTRSIMERRGAGDLHPTHAQ